MKIYILDNSEHCCKWCRADVYIEVDIDKILKENPELLITTVG